MKYKKIKARKIQKRWWSDALIQEGHLGYMTIIFKSLGKRKKHSRLIWKYPNKLWEE